MEFIQGTPGPDILFGGPDADQIVGYGGNDILSGGGGEDHLYGGTGLDTLDGGPGFDLGQLNWSGFFPREDGFIFVYDGANAFAFHNGQIYAQTVSVEQFQITGSDGNDWIETGGADDELSGGAGNDVLKGNAGNDILWYSGGNDQLYGGDGTDHLFVGSDPPPDSTMTFFAAPSSEISGIYIDGRLSTCVTGVERYGFYTGGGDDILFGGAADDSFFCDGGNNYVSGGGGNDEIDFFIRHGGAIGENQGYGGDGDDDLVGYKGRDTLVGGAGNDDLHGSEGNDLLIGDDGNDSIYPGLEDDTAFGGAGDDFISDVGFGQGNDIISAGTGADLIILDTGTNYTDLGPPDGAQDVIDISRNTSLSTDLGTGLSNVVWGFETGIDKIDVSPASIEPVPQFTFTNGLDLDGDGLLNDARVIVSFFNNYEKITDFVHTTLATTDFI